MLVSPGFHTLVSLDPLVVKKQSKPGSECKTADSVLYECDYLQDDCSQPVRVNYTRSRCLVMKKQRAVIDRCGCVTTDIAYFSEWSGDQRMLVNDSMAYSGRCFDLRRDGVTSLTQMSGIGTCVETAKAEFERGLRNGSIDCAHPCELTATSVETSMAKWPMPLIESDALQLILKEYLRLTNTTSSDNPMLQDLMYFYNITDSPANTSITQLPSQSRVSSFVADNFYRVTVANKLARASVISEQFSYGAVDFLSDVGGMLGLYLGVSVLTLCELLGLPFRLVGVCGVDGSQQKTRHSDDKGHKNRVTPVTQVQPITQVEPVTQDQPSTCQ